MYEADLRFAQMTAAKLVRANLFRANLNGTDLSEADLTEAELSRAQLVRTNLSRAILNGCHIYGIAAWDLMLEGAQTHGLIISMDPDDVCITIDDLDVAQFLYLLIENKKIRKAIESITSKVVLILGRFTTERKLVLDSMRERLHTMDYVPVMFDFEKPIGRDTHETITLLARMARFIIADITDAASVREELTVIVPHLPSVAVLPLLQSGTDTWTMFDHVRRFSWVMDVVEYSSLSELLDTFETSIIAPVERKVQEIRG
jgi:hypothetical protein